MNTNKSNNNTIRKSSSNKKTRHEKVGGDNDSTRAVIGSHSHSNTNNDSSSNCYHKPANTNRKKLPTLTKNVFGFFKRLAKILTKLRSFCLSADNDIVNKKAYTSRFNLSNNNENNKAPLRQCLNLSTMQRTSSEFKVENGEEKNYDGKNNSAMTINPLIEQNPKSSNLAITPQQDEDLARMLRKNYQSIIDQDYQYALAVKQSLTSDKNKYNERDIPFQFVTEIIERHNRIRNSPKGSDLIENMAIDSLYDVTCKMLKCQQDFLNGNGYDTDTPVEVTIHIFIWCGLYRIAL